MAGCDAAITARARRSSSTSALGCPPSNNALTSAGTVTLSQVPTVGSSCQSTSGFQIRMRFLAESYAIVASEPQYGPLAGRVGGFRAVQRWVSPSHSQKRDGEDDEGAPHMTKRRRCRSYAPVTASMAGGQTAPFAAGCSTNVGLTPSQSNICTG